MQLKTSLKKTSAPLLARLLDLTARSCCRLSNKQLQKLASLLTFFSWHLIKLRRREVIDSLQLHLELSPTQAKATGKMVYRHFLLNSLTMAKLAYMEPQQLIDSCKIVGREHLDTAVARKKGVIIISGHFGLWEMMPHWLALHKYQVCTVVRRQNNQYVDAWMERMRQRFGGKTTDSGFGIREILRSLRKGQILALMVDQDNGKQGVFVPFFKRYASAPTGPALLSLKTGAPIVPLFMFPDYQRQHIFKIYPPIYPENYSNDTVGQQQLTARYTKQLEELIKKQPQQWFWLHRRWKTQPTDAPDNPWSRLILASEQL